MTLAHAKHFFKVALEMWFGEAPVGKETALARTRTCKACPKHNDKDWLRYVTQPVSDIVRQQLSIKRRMRLWTEEERGLGLCDMCKCQLAFKVWVPLEVARENTPDWQGFPEACWLRTEEPTK